MTVEHPAAIAPAVMICLKDNLEFIRVDL
jgi:hypothetical protein